MFLTGLLLAPWINTSLRERSRVGTFIVQLLFWVGFPMCFLEIVYVPRWGIRLRDTPNDTSVIYGSQAQIALVTGAIAVLINLALAWRHSRRRV